jgi:hypothetical protein
MPALLLLIPAIVLLALGTEGIVHASRARHQVTVSCDQFAQAPPSSPRLRVTGCQVDLAGAAYRESGGKIEELFFPARPANRTTPAPLVASVRDPSALAMAQRILGTGQSATAVETLGKIAESLQLSNAIDGVVRAGVIERFRTRRILSGLTESVAANATLIDVHGTPSLVSSALALAGGLVLAAIPWLITARRRAPAVVPSASAAKEDAKPAAPAAPAPPPVSVLLPRLLLLNVDVMSGPEAVESAPPLGSRHNVVDILCGVVPDLEVSDSGGALARRDGSLKFDLGAPDPVPTVVVEAHGEAGVALVKEVLLMTGWRAFAPKTGLFVTTDDLESLAALADGR